MVSLYSQNDEIGIGLFFIVNSQLIIQGLAYYCTKYL